MSLTDQPASVAPRLVICRGVSCWRRASSLPGSARISWSNKVFGRRLAMNETPTAEAPAQRPPAVCLLVSTRPSDFLAERVDGFLKCRISMLISCRRLVDFDIWRNPAAFESSADRHQIDPAREPDLDSGSFQFIRLRVAASASSRLTDLRQALHHLHKPFAAANGARADDANDRAGKRLIRCR